MPHKAKNTGSKKRRIVKAPAAEQTVPLADGAPHEEVPLQEEAPLQDRVIERPDGFYWESEKGETHGPFKTLAEAEADMLSGGAAGDELEEGGLQEAESELGISEWIDPDTGGPAEDNVPRIEDH